jgi:hypothetical protein
MNIPDDLKKSMVDTLISQDLERGFEKHYVQANRNVYEKRAVQLIGIVFKYLESRGEF